MNPNLEDVRYLNILHRFTLSIDLKFKFGLVINTKVLPNLGPSIITLPVLLKNPIFAPIGSAIFKDAESRTFA